MDRRDDLGDATQWSRIHRLLEFCPAARRKTSPRRKPKHCSRGCVPGMPSAGPDGGWRPNSSPSSNDRHAEQGRGQGTPRARRSDRHHTADLHGIGPSAAARLLIDVGDIARFPTAVTSHPGTAPHRSTPPPVIRTGTGSPAPATGRSTVPSTSWPSCSCDTTPGPPLLRPQRPPARQHGSDALSETPTVRRRLQPNGRRRQTRGAGPGGHPGTTVQSSVADSHPHIDTSDQSLPGPATTKPTTALPAAS